MASMQLESGWIVYAGSDFQHPVQFFSEEGPDHINFLLCKTGPDPIWMAWSGFSQTHLAQKQASVQELSDLVLAERNRPPTSFPHSDYAVLFHRQPRSYCAKPAWI